MPFEISSWCEIRWVVVISACHGWLELRWSKCCTLGHAYAAVKGYGSQLDCTSRGCFQHYVSSGSTGAVYQCFFRHDPLKTTIWNAAIWTTSEHHCRFCFRCRFFMSFSSNWKGTGLIEISPSTELEWNTKKNGTSSKAPSPVLHKVVNFCKKVVYGDTLLFFKRVRYCCSVSEFEFKMLGLCTSPSYILFLFGRSIKTFDEDSWKTYKIWKAVNKFSKALRQADSD